MNTNEILELIETRMKFERIECDAPKSEKAASYYLGRFDALNSLYNRIKELEEREASENATPQQTVADIIAPLTADEQQLLKDAINCGEWGDTDCEFLNKNQAEVTCSALGFCTNDAHAAGHFKGREIATMFRAVYKKLGLDGKGRGTVISHCSDWWGNGAGDMMFIRKEFVKAFKEWAKRA